jgi:uncharacterized protein (TIGR03067 family)
MLLPTFALVLASALPADTPKPTDKPAALDGTWSVQSATREGMPSPDDMVKNTKFVFSGNKVMVKEGDRKPEEATITIDASKKPATIDIKPSNGPADRLVKGIYQLDGDTLKLCFRREGDRPTEFASTAENKAVLMVLTRDKK